jgi:3,4-dihydroxy 2-butanone 4-phosphate synthase/GTP cyclohydrolase II
VPIVHAANPHNERYLQAKRDRLGHALHHQGLPLDEEMVHDEHRADAGGAGGPAADRGPGPRPRSEP